MNLRPTRLWVGSSRNSSNLTASTDRRLCRDLCDDRPAVVDAGLAQMLALVVSAVSRSERLLLVFIPADPSRGLTRPAKNRIAELSTATDKTERVAIHAAGEKMKMGLVVVMLQPGYGDILRHQRAVYIPNFGPYDASATFRAMAGWPLPATRSRAKWC